MRSTVVHNSKVSRKCQLLLSIRFVTIFMSRFTCKIFVKIFLCVCVRYTAQNSFRFDEKKITISKLQFDQFDPLYYESKVELSLLLTF